jgi:hypothetical protein
VLLSLQELDTPVFIIEPIGSFFVIVVVNVVVLVI